ncbi:hypothetical protein LTR29_017835 [Friedmanniomyces endolithicus]|nr:hypothetical protein LTR01_009172 [Friedmanniomyces endolithicus]KAK0926492.1 hypothetical protein LTR29_017835 [Friedmanniomyces endolithicus]
MSSDLTPPSLPPGINGVPPVAGSVFRGPPPPSLPTPTSASTKHAEFLLSFGEPLHPELDEAIATGDGALVSSELARARERYPQTNVTFNTALQCAIKLAVPHEQLVSWLLSKDADSNLQDAWSETPLSRAVEFGSLNVISRLLDAGADVSKGAPLHMSLRRKDNSASLELMEKLLVLGAPVDKYQGEDSSAWKEVGFPRGTALHSASSRGNTRAVQLLLTHGADPLRNKKLGASEIPDSSPYEEARYRGHAEVMSVLQKHIRCNDSFHRYRL